MKKQFLGIKWTDNVPYFRLYDKDSNNIDYLEVPKHLDILKNDDKRCIGYYDLDTNKYMPCKHFVDVFFSKYDTCVECDLLSGFSKCLGCNGQHCLSNSSKAIDFCDNTTHLVYLAYFPGNKIKVGTAAKYRNLERLIEQGALVSCFISETPNGKLARDIEYNVSKCNITTKVNASYKMKNLVIDKDISEIECIFRNKLKEISESLTSDLTKYLFNNITVNKFDTIILNLDSNLKTLTAQTMLFGEDTIVMPVEAVNNPTEIIGDLVQVVGYLLLVKNNDNFFVYNTNSLKGYIIDI